MKHLIFKLINDKIQSCDFYNHNQSFWLIETNEKKWVFELTKEKTLWYNFYFFENIFNFFSLNVVENQHYITEWVEDTIQNVVRSTLDNRYHPQIIVEDIIQNGVKKTLLNVNKKVSKVEDTIQNGVKETNWRRVDNFPEFEERVLLNGIKETWGYDKQPQMRVNQVLLLGKSNFFN